MRPHATNDASKTRTRAPPPGPATSRSTTRTRWSASSRSVARWRTPWTVRRFGRSHRSTSPSPPGGIVPPALQGHTPDIALRFDPEAARRLLAEVDPPRELALGCLDDDRSFLEPAVEGWRDVLGL